MTPGETHSLDRLIEQNRSFAIYRAPGEPSPRFIIQEQGEPALFDNLDDLNGKQGFIIAPFHLSPGHPAILLRPGCTCLPEFGRDGDHRTETQGEAPSTAIDQRSYSPFFTSFMTALESGRFEKLVLSRSIGIPRPPSFSPARAFALACKLYPGSFVYLCHTPHSGTWLGSTPEILLSGQGGKWKTVALAGTRTETEAAEDQRWDEKNLREQSLVSDYIRERLGAFGAATTEQSLQTATSGGLTHLKTDFDFTLPGNSRLGSLLAQLHPTPAICGLPKDDAFRFILEHEGYDRGYYSGFIGPLNPEGQSDIYVNLRCMQIRGGALTLYAGGGLLPSSVMPEELRELNDKLQIMLALTRS